VNASLVSRSFAVNVIKIIAACAFIFMASSASAGWTKVTLKDGKTYKVKTVRGLPAGFSNDQIKVHDIGGTAHVTAETNALSFEWYLVAKLLATGQFTVTINTLLDSSASATLEATGPGTIKLNFFPQTGYPKIWEGIDRPGVHWFPFHFVFEEKQSKDRFEFTQWAQFDHQHWKAIHEFWEKKKQEMLEKRNP